MGRSERLARLRLILGDDAVSALGQATVMVLGLGGVGASCAEALARGGIGSLILIDGDLIEESNINRQALAFVSTIGHAKTDVMSAMVADINPDCVVHAQQLFLTRDNLSKVFETFPRPDYVIDCIDTMTQKLAVVEWCAHHEVRLLSSMGAANKMDPCRLEFVDVQHTHHCPVSTVMRRECRKRGITNLEVLFSGEESVVVQQHQGTTKGETLGSMSYMPPVMGQMLAGLVLRRLAGIEPLPVPPQLNQSQQP